MTRTFQLAAFVAGLIVIAWVGAGYIPGNPLALALVLLIGAFYGAGALELRRFQQATTSLVQRLDTSTDAPPALGPWLAALHPSLQHAVRLRIEGERVALPGPALTPYLAGLLVLLGMLGTFLGMVVTLRGTGLALETATDLDAIRATLSAPVKGLGLAFGTSVAGVAASAMLGLMSALARRERQGAAQRLDAHIATTLRSFSRAHQREESLRLLRVQAEVMPALVEQLQGLVAQLAAQGQSLQDRLFANQAQFHGEAQRAYTGLAESVDRSLQTSLAESARLAGAAIEPAVQATLAGLARESATLREVLAGAVQQQLEGVTARLDHTAAAVLDGVGARMDRHADVWTEAWREALAEQRQAQAAMLQHTNESLSTLLAGFEQHAAALLRSVGEAHAAWEASSSTAMAERQQQICTTLQSTAQGITAQAEAHARATIGEITRLVQSASEAPRAAAEVIGELRSALSDSLVRDNAALDERNRLLATLGGLLDAVEHAGTEQRAAIDELVQATTEVLERVGTRFAATVEAESRTLQTVAAQVTGSAAEVASLGEGFGAAVNLFGQASERLAAQLQAIEAALGQSMARSDEQLAYYVAQAREIIDLTLGSQKQIVEDLQRLGRTPAEAEAA